MAPVCAGVMHDTQDDVSCVVCVQEAGDTVVQSRLNQTKTIGPIIMRLIMKIWVKGVI